MNGMEDKRAGPVTGWAAGIVGAVAGYLTGRLAAAPAVAAIDKLASAVISQAAMATAGPIIASAIVAGSTIIAAVAVPCAVALVITKRGQS